MREALRDRFRELELNKQVRVVIVTGNGKAFCAGADLKEGFAESVQDQIHERFLPAVQPIREIGQVVISAVNGTAAGIGVTMVTASDMAVMSDAAVMNLAFSRIALIPDGGLTWDLVRSMGYKRAYQLMIEGGSLTAQQCLDYGIVNELTPADQVLARARALAEQVAELSPIANKLTKRALRRSMDLSLQAAVDYESALQERASKSGDSAEGIAAFLEKRKPNFPGN
jgi:2-(1,2-epoxy-1,2-dihydrophenyl)acetyl-CoA isomerase